MWNSVVLLTRIGCRFLDDVKQLSTYCVPKKGMFAYVLKIYIKRCLINGLYRLHFKTCWRKYRKMWSIFVLKVICTFDLHKNISIDLYITIKRSLFFKRYDILWNCVYIWGKQKCICTCNQKKSVSMFSFHENLKNFWKTKEQTGNRQVISTIHLYTKGLLLLVIYLTISQYVVFVTFQYVFIIRYTLFTMVK